MAFPVVSNTYVEKIQMLTDRFSKLYPALVYNDDISLAKLIAKNAQYATAIKTRNEAAVFFSNSIDIMNREETELSQMESRFLALTGDKFTKDSDEYVWAGGTRQSESIEKRKATLEENQRLEKLRVEAETAKAAADKAKAEAEIMTLRAEVALLRAEKEKKV